MTWANFTREEFACKQCGRNFIQDELIDKLQSLRTKLGIPLVVTSGYRCAEYNAKISETGENGPHTTGYAADISIRGPQALELVVQARAIGFTGIGISQKGPSRFVHLDMLTPPEFPRPTIWSY